ncbi:MAG: beta strand repeat-containing protein, partial [Planctomycetia bacterium]
GNGIVVTNRASGNLIGGFASAGNDPTGDVFVRPPQGNLISGNRETGVLIICNSTANTLSGNFVGTTASGNAALGNGADGVAIVNASGNALLGTTFPQDPFVFYNVLSGNGGNGLRITNSNDTIVQANFTGVGADNATVVANGGSGILVNGTSARTIVGGPIPLGNVNSGNNRYGIEVAGTASGFVAFNSFVGMVAFGEAAPNRLDGIRITSTGGNNLIRTCLVGGNLGNGIVIAGRATGVTVEDTSVGTDSKISAAIPNQGSGIVITDDAHGNTIGGFQASVQTKVHLSGNLRYGLEIIGNARNNRIINSVIGGGFEAFSSIPNTLGGIYVGPRTIGTIIGGTNPLEANRVLTNGGAGITISGSYGTVVLGNEIRSNAGTGILLAAARAATIGVVGAGNTIVANTGYGLFASGNCFRTRVVRNTIVDNTLGNVDISSATGITYVP